MWKAARVATRCYVPVTNSTLLCLYQFFVAVMIICKRVLQAGFVQHMVSSGFDTTSHSKRGIFIYQLYYLTKVQIFHSETTKICDFKNV